MYARTATGMVLAASLLFSPIVLAGDKGDVKKAPAVKKDTTAGKGTTPATGKDSKSISGTKSTAKTPATGKDWRSGMAPTVRAIPYQGSTTRPWATATTRPAGEYTFKTPARYDYFVDHYGFSTGSPSTDVVGYVPPENSKDNSGNPFIYRRNK